MTDTAETGTDTGAVVVPGVCPRFQAVSETPETRTDTDNDNNVDVSPRFFVSAESQTRTDTDNDNDVGVSPRFFGYNVPA